MDTLELIERAKAAAGLPSDYALARRLGLLPSYVAMWRKRRQVSEETALRLAELAELPPGFVLASLAAERAQSDAARRAWSELADQLHPPLVITLSRRRGPLPRIPRALAHSLAVS